MGRLGMRRLTAVEAGAGARPAHAARQFVPRNKMAGRTCNLRSR